MTEESRKDIVSSFTKAGILGAIILVLFGFMQHYTLEPARLERLAFIDTYKDMSTAVKESQLRSERMTNGLVDMMRQFTAHVPAQHDEMEELLKGFSERQDIMWEQVQRSHRKWNKE